MYTTFHFLLSHIPILHSRAFCLRMYHNSLCTHTRSFICIHVNWVHVDLAVYFLSKLFPSFSQTLLNEITSYDGNIQSVSQSAQDLISSDHFAADTIEEQDRELQHQWRQLKLLAASRTRKLSDALEAQKVGVYHGVCASVCVRCVLCMYLYMYCMLLHSMYVYSYEHVLQCIVHVCCVCVCVCT